MNARLQPFLHSFSVNSSVCTGLSREFSDRRVNADWLWVLRVGSYAVFTSRGRSAKRGRVIVHVRMFVCLSVCLISKRVSGSSYTVENASSAALVPSSPEMKPVLAAVGSATVAVLSQSSGVAAIFVHEAGSRGLQ